MRSKLENTIIVYDTDPDWLTFARACFVEDDMEGRCSNDLEELRRHLSQSHSKDTLVFLDDISFREELSAFQEIMKRHGEDRFVVLYDLDFDLDKAHDAFKAGATDYVSKPYSCTDLKVMAEQAAAQARVSRWEPASTGNKNAAVLVVEDDHDWLKSVLDNLPPLKIEVAKDYETAKKKISNSRFDLVISDWLLDETDMGKLEGIRLLHDMRSPGSRNGQTPVIVMSAYGTPEDICEAYRRWNINYFFSKKKVNYPMLLQTVNEALNAGAPA